MCKGEQVRERLLAHRYSGLAEMMHTGLLMQHMVLVAKP
jgi:hypothetical protein